MDKDILKNMSPEQMMNQAQHIWQMLDDMASNDPQAYRKFIDKQMKEGKEIMKPPEPHMCLRTKIVKPYEDTLYLNVFSYLRVPEPKSDESPIPVMGSQMYKGKDNMETYKIINIAFNPKVTEEFGINSSLVRERDMLINLGLDFVQDQQKITISRNYNLLDKTVPYKGALAKAIETLSKKFQAEDKQFEQELSQLEKNFGPMVQGSKDSLLNELSNIAINEQNPDLEYVLDDPKESLDKKPEIKLSTETKVKTSLIEEIGKPYKSLPEPVYDLDQQEQLVVLKITLPGVLSVQECELDISEKDVHLLVEGKYELSLPLETKVCEETSKAKFHKKLSVLSLTMPKL